MRGEKKRGAQIEFLSDLCLIEKLNWCRMSEQYKCFTGSKAILFKNIHSTYLLIIIKYTLKSIGIRDIKEKREKLKNDFSTDLNSLFYRYLKFSIHGLNVSDIVSCVIGI